MYLLPSHYGFTLSSEQLHIDMAVNALKNMSIPQMI
jgi:hypothetical protein